VRARHLYDYAIVRVVPRPEREEFLNVGVILSCPALRFLDARIELDKSRLCALAPGIDSSSVQTHLSSIPLICRGGKAAGPIGLFTARERYHWLIATRSAVIQTSFSHTGWCEDAEATLEDLMDRMVRIPRI
jgi:hypothetical protein